MQECDSYLLIEAQVLQFPSATLPIYLALQGPSWHIHNYIAAQHSYHTSSSSCVAHAVSIRRNGISNLDNSDKLYVDIQQRVYSHHSIKYRNWHMINITVIFNFWKKISNQIISLHVVADNFYNSGYFVLEGCIV